MPAPWRAAVDRRQRGLGYERGRMPSSLAMHEGVRAGQDPHQHSPSRSGLDRRESGRA